jgi:hypothetical protein
VGKAIRMISGGELARRAGVSKQIVSKLAAQEKLPRIANARGRLGYDENDPVIIDYIERQSSQRRNAHRSGASRASVSAYTPGKTRSRAKGGQGKGADLEASSDSGASAGAPTFESQERLSVLSIGKPDKRDKKKDASDEGDESYNVYDRRKQKAWAEKLELANKITRNEYLPRAEIFRVLGKVYSVHSGVIRPLGAKLGDQIAAEFGATDPAKVLRAQEIIDDETYSALSQIKRELDCYLAGIGAGTIEE